MYSLCSEQHAPLTPGHAVLGLGVPCMVQWFKHVNSNAASHLPIEFWSFTLPLQELIRMKQLGHEAACLFIIQRNDCDRFSPCAAKDPKFAELLSRAHAAGVAVIAARCSLQPDVQSSAVVRFLGTCEVLL